MSDQGLLDTCHRCGGLAAKLDADGYADCPRCHPHRFHDCHSLLNPGRRPWPWATKDCGFWRHVGGSPERDYCGGCEYGLGSDV